MSLRKKISLCRSTRLRCPRRYFCHLHPQKNFPKVFVFRWKCLCRNVRGAWINYFFKSVFSEMLFYFCVLAVCWSASYAIAYWSSFMQWRSHPHQLRIALMPDTNIISSNKKIGLCRTLGLTQSRKVCIWEGPQKLFPKGFVHHFVMSKVAGIHQQVKLVDECQMFLKSSIGQSKSWSMQWTKFHCIDQTRSQSTRHRRWVKMTEIFSLSLDLATIGPQCNA